MCGNTHFDLAVPVRASRLKTGEQNDRKCAQGNVRQRQAAHLKKSLGLLLTI